MAFQTSFGFFDVGKTDSVFEFESDNVSSDEELLTALISIEEMAQFEALIDEMETNEPQVQEPPEVASTSMTSSTTEGGILTDQKPENERFASVNEEDMDEIVRGISSKGTATMTKWGVSQFKMWLSQRGMSPNFEEEEESYLDQILARFYADLRTADGKMYSKSTFVGLRASINRHLRSPPNNRPINLMQDRAFMRSNKVFTGMLVKMKKEGLDIATHHSAITDMDLEKLRKSNVFNLETPKGLQRKVWFDLALGFGRRGQENVQNLKKTTYEIKKDSSSFKYIQMTYNESTKNHKGTNLRDDDTQKPRLYETKQDDCPVKSYEKYVSKLNPQLDRLFQHPKMIIKETDNVWYNKRPLGQRSIGTIMKEISTEANLSQIYTNHCVRATTITKLAHAGVEKSEIMKLTGHRNIKSLDSYNTDSSENQKRQYSSILQTSNESPATSTSMERENQIQLAVTQPGNSVTPPTQNYQSIQNNLMINAHAQMQPQAQKPIPSYYFTNANVTINNY